MSRLNDSGGVDWTRAAAADEELRQRAIRLAAYASAFTVGNHRPSRPRHAATFRTRLRAWWTVRDNRTLHEVLGRVPRAHKADDHE